MPSKERQKDAAIKQDDQLFRRVSLAWLAQDYAGLETQVPLRWTICGVEVKQARTVQQPVQAPSASQQVQIQKIRASIARDLAMSKRSGQPQSLPKKRHMRPKQPPPASSQGPGGLPSVVLGETKHMVKAPNPPCAASSTASSVTGSRKMVPGCASTNSIETATFDLMRGSESAGRLQSSRQGSSSTGNTALAPRAAVITQGSEELLLASRLVLSKNLSEWELHPGWKQSGSDLVEQSGPRHPEEMLMMKQRHSAANMHFHTKDQPDSCPSEEGSDGSAPVHSEKGPQSQALACSSARAPAIPATRYFAACEFSQFSRDPTPIAGVSTACTMHICTII
jgi:hypothetical protein